jgi:NAD(P)H-flavin reductase
LLFRKELEAWNYVPDTQVLISVDYGGVNWHGYVGFVPKLFRFTRINPANTIAIMCGPEVMMRACIQELSIRGVPDDQIYLSMERNMKCAVGFCGHCQLGPYFVCKDGPVFPYSKLMQHLDRYEL